MDLLARFRADIRRPEAPSDHDDLWFNLVVPVIVVAISQLLYTGSVTALLLLVPAVAAYWVRALRGLPAEVFAGVVFASVVASVGTSGDLEGSFFLIAIAVLYTSASLGSTTRAAVIAAVGTLVEWVVVVKVVPEAGIV